MNFSGRYLKKRAWRVKAAKGKYQDKKNSVIIKNYLCISVLIRG